MKSKDEPDDDDDEVYQPDGGYGWFVVMSAFTVGFITDGIVFSYGILLVDLLDTFQASRAATVVVGSIVTCLMHITGPIVGALSDRCGCRVVVVTGSLISCLGFICSAFATKLPHLYITYGFMGGLGFGLMYLPANISVIKHFTKRRSLANGIAVCGSGVGTFVFNILTRYLLDQYAWRGTILLQAGIALQGVICGLFLLPPKPPHRPVKTKEKELKEYVQYTAANESEKALIHDNHDIRNVVNDNDSETKINKHDDEKNTVEDNLIENKDSVKKDTEKSKKTKLVNLRSLCKEMFNISLLRDIKCSCFLLMGFLVNLGFTIPFNLLPDQAIESGMDKYEAAWLVSAIGISNTSSRILLGWLGDRQFANRFVMLVTMLFLTGIFTGLSPFFVSFPSKMFYSCVFGVLIGGFVTLVPVVLADMFGPEMISKSFGLLMFAVGVSGLIASPIGGWIFDVTGSYDISFILAGVAFFLGAVVMLIPKFFRQNKQSQDSNSLDINV